MAGMQATWSLSEHLGERPGERNAIDTLTQSVPRQRHVGKWGWRSSMSPTVIRPYPDVVAFLQHVEHENFLDELPMLTGGRRDRVVTDTGSVRM